MLKSVTRAILGASPLLAGVVAINSSGSAGPTSRIASAGEAEAENVSSFQRIQRKLQLLSLYSGNSMAHCEAEATSAVTVETDTGDDLGDIKLQDDDESSLGGLNPGDFAHREDEKSFNVSPSEGVMLMMQSTIGQPGRDSAAVAAQMSLSSAGVNNVWILSDQKSPGLQAVLQPGPEGGKLLKVAVNGRPGWAPGVASDAEVLLGSTGVQQVKSTSKYNGDDFFASLSVTPLGQGPPNAEFNYHQAVAQGWTAGGSVALAFEQLYPLPSVGRVVWGTYGSWMDFRRRDRAVFWRLSSTPRQDGSESLSLGLQTWQRVSKGLEMGANVTLASPAGGGPAWLPLPLPASFPPDAHAGVGARMTFDGPGGLNPILTAHVSTAGVASLQWQKPTASGMTNTFMRTTLSAVLDHPKRDYKWGVQLELYY